MNSLDVLRSFVGWFGGGRGALGDVRGLQRPFPATQLIDGVANIGADGALQISAVWACVERRANVVASLPFFAFNKTNDSEKTIAYGSQLYSLLHDSPNSRHTPYEFWRAMMLNHDLRGNAYARLERNGPNGNVTAMWPMASDQVETALLEDGSMVYMYRINNDVAVLAEPNVLHLRNLGNGTVGLSKLEYMRASTTESASAQLSANRLFANGGKPTGLLMVDAVLNPAQREAIKQNFIGMVSGSINSLHVLEANMKFQQLSLSPADQQLLETRRFTIEEMCRWYDVPPVLVHHSNVTTWGTGIESILDGWYKLSVRPILVSIEQAVRKRVMTPVQRASMSGEFNFDALLRANSKDRAEFYASAVQNGWMTRGEVRQLENLAPDDTANELTAQSNLVTLDTMNNPPPAPTRVPTGITAQVIGNDRKPGAMSRIAA